MYKTVYQNEQVRIHTVIQSLEYCTVPWKYCTAKKKKKKILHS